MLILQRVHYFIKFWSEVARKHMPLFQGLRPIYISPARKVISERYTLVIEHCSCTHGQKKLTLLVIFDARGNGAQRLLETVHHNVHITIESCGAILLLQ